MIDPIERQAAIDIVEFECGEWSGLARTIAKAIEQLPPTEPEPSIPISWIEKQINWLKSMDNEFSNIVAMNISVFVKKWKKENGKDEGSY